MVDDGLKQGTAIGPLQNKMQYEKVKGFLEDARANGKVIAGRRRTGAGRLFHRAHDRAGHSRQRAPGPRRAVSDPFCRCCPSRMSMMPLPAPTTPEYGLGGSVWAGDVERGVAVASKVESGTVWVNQWLDMPFDVPFRGAKQSGIGGENGQEGIEEYTQARIINVAL